MKNAWIVAAVAVLALTVAPSASARHYHPMHHMRMKMHHMAYHRPMMRHHMMHPMMRHHR